MHVKWPSICTLQRVSLRPLASALIFAAYLTGSVASANSSDDANLEVTFRPYAWIANGKASADLTSLGGGVTQLDLSTSALLDGVKIGGMGAIEIRRDPVVFVIDGAYGRFGLEGANVDPTFASANLEIRAALFNLLTGYSVMQRERTNVSAIAGVRILHAEFDAIQSPGPDQQTISVPIVNDTIADPVVGLLATHRIADGIHLTTYGDIGGAGIGSDRTWQVYGSIAIDITERISLDVGYRRVKWSFDPSKTDVLQTLRPSGPLIGFQWRF